ncbi:SLC13 family permease [Clostridium sp. MT-113]|uniref:SLC13 family permease n=2 Tax=Clostridiaceae TaxID=31979 RepID=A0ABV4DYK9_9CLOT|nr:C4-dicarboxylate ABC transporter [Clostridiales bacterium]
MIMQIVSLIFLIGAIILGVVKKINVGIVCLGLALILAMIGGVNTKIIFNGFPTKLFITLLGTMYLFSMLQENKTLELLSKKIILLVGKRTFFIPIIMYVVSYVLSAAGPGAISVQAVTIIFAVSLAVEMNVSAIMMGTLAFLGSVGGTASPIALTGIIVGDLLSAQKITGIHEIQVKVFLGVTLVNLICAVIVYIVFKGYKINSDMQVSVDKVPKFNTKQKISLIGLITLAVLVIGFQLDVGLISFLIAVILTIFKVSDEKMAMKLVPWSVLILVCGVGVLMAVTQSMGGITLLAKILASFMNGFTAAPIIGLTAGIMTWFSSANGVVMPTLIPTVPKLVMSIGGSANIVEMVSAIVSCSTLSGISPLSTAGCLLMAGYTQDTGANEKEQQSLFIKLFILCVSLLLFAAALTLVGIFKPFI